MADSTQSFRLENGQPVILGTQCSHCQYCWFPGVEYGCERCGSFGDSLSTKSLSTKGHLISIAEISPGTDKAFILSTIELEDGPAIRGVIGTTPEENDAPLKVGDPVVGRIENIDDKIVIRFYGVARSSA